MFKTNRFKKTACLLLAGLLGVGATACDFGQTSNSNSSVEEQKEETRKVLGSTNQRIIILTDRYPNCEEWFFDSTSKEVEVNVGDYIVANGDAVL